MTYDKLWRHRGSQRIGDLMGVLAHTAVSGTNRPECIAEALLAAVGAARRRPCAFRGIAIGT